MKYEIVFEPVTRYEFMMQWSKLERISRRLDLVWLVIVLIIFCLVAITFFKKEGK